MASAAGIHSFYSTATGNSLYVACQLADKHTKLLSIPQYATDAFLPHADINPETGFLMRSERYFDLTNACVDGGICTEVCPQENYEMTSRRANTEGDCDFCFACSQNCLLKEIHFKTLPDEPLLTHGELTPHARYRNKHVSLWSIKEANRQ